MHKSITARLPFEMMGSCFPSRWAGASHSRLRPRRPKARSRPDPNRPNVRAKRKPHFGGARYAPSVEGVNYEEMMTAITGGVSGKVTDVTDEESGERVVILVE